MKKLRYLLLTTLLLAASTAQAQSNILGRNLFPEGTFDIFGESLQVPSGWKFPDPNDKPWQKGFRVDLVKGEGGTKELRMVNPDFGFTSASASIDLPPKIDRLRVSFRVLPKRIELGAPDPAGNGAGIYLRFYDKDGKSIQAAWVGAGQIKSTDAEWQDRESIFNVPTSAYRIGMEVVFRSAKGEVRVDDIELVPVGVTE